MSNSLKYFSNDDIETQENLDVQFDSFQNQNHSQSKDLLPKKETNAQDHDICFRTLNGLLRITRILQQQKKQIQNEDIKEFITKSTQIQFTVEELEDYKIKNPLKFKQSNKFKLMPVYFHMTNKYLFIGLFFSLAQIFLESSCVQMLDLITDKLKLYQGQSSEKRDLCLCLVGISVFYLLKNICYTRFYWYEAKWQSKANATLQYLVFTKYLKLQEISKGQKNDQDKLNEQKTEETPDINTIMTSDIEQQMYLYRTFIQSTAGIFSVVTALIFIYIKIGKYMLNGLYVLIVAFIINFIAVQVLHVFYRKQYKTKDQRISLTNDVIDGIKSIKFLGWEDIFRQKIENIRSKEFGYVICTKIFDLVQVTIFTVLSYLMLFLFLTSYVSDGNSLSDSNIFTIIALYDIMNMPLTYLPWNVATFQKLIVSYKRINTFLNQKEINSENVIKEYLNHDQNLEEGNLIQSNQSSKVTVQIQEMKFTWPEQECESIQDQSCKRKFELKIPDLKVFKGELVVVIGKIGSGKSAFLQAILNELDGINLHFQNGDRQNLQDSHKETNLNKIYLNGKTAYVPQNHWLQNKTIKENILFGKDYVSEWYDECIEACDLKPDLDSFLLKDEKLVGPGGANLSGGQRQRVAICRALYQNCDIYLLDDIFSSLDAHVAQKVFQSVVIRLLVQKYKKTVFLVTSHFSIFSNRKNISQILYLENGSLINDSYVINKFIQNGLNREQLEEKTNNSSNLKVAQLGVSKQQEIQKDHLLDNLTNNDQVSLLKKEFKENENQEQKQIRNQDIQESIFDEQNQNEKILADEKNEEMKEDQDQNDNLEERESGNVKLTTFKVYFKSVGAILLIALVIFNYLMSGTQMLIDFWLRDYISSSSPFYQSVNQIFNSFTNTFLFFIILNIMVNIFRALIFSISSLLGSKMLFKKLNTSIIYSKMNFFDKNPVGRIISRLSDDITVIDDQLPWSFDYLIGLLAATANYTFAILIQFPWLIIFVVASVLLFYFVQKTFRTLTVEIKRLNSVNSGRLLSTLGETSKGLILIRSFNKQRYILKEFLERLNESVNTNVINQALQIWMSIRLLFISNLIFISVALTHIMLLFLNCEIEYTTVAMCITYSMLFSQRFTEVVRFFSYVEINIVSVERIRQYFDNKQECLEQIENSEDIQISQEIEMKIQEIKRIQNRQNQIEEIYQKCKKDENFVVEFEDVWLSYDDLQDNQNQQIKNKDINFALKGITLQIKKGEKIAFCGRTGSGKTSILNILYRMYPIQYGNIIFKGKKIESYSLKQLRSQMSVIPQFGFIYNATLKDNIDPEDKIPNKEIQKKLQNTNLSISKYDHRKLQKQERSCQEEFLDEELRFISQSQDQQSKTNQIDLDFEIKEGGSNLSNGEKQIVNFFRIIMRETEIVCLDEATSNMDPKTDQEIHEQIFQFARDKTLIVITHRLENIDQFDRVVVLEEGRIVECGKVTDLRQIQGSFFNKLINDQVKCQNKQNYI
ncbi:hypothetical protein ABPG74_019269 [Tetrahymena malaccensis]